ncbi:hypothetical protein KFK09_024797 [Dendrobium nobile]|uniref:Uncharacterized protein n=1 Tax=Dendrobium nobile TaxID=94219 RepID=A0A8T3AK86_DENNO|nr:hypothetical protein KFK09_024797 [Dendrobium nobile]
MMQSEGIKMPKKKKAKVEGSGEGEGSGHVDEEFVRSIRKIKYIQTELQKINVEEDDKVLEVLQEYTEIRKEFYNRRNEVLLTIADFWLTVLINHPILGEFLSAEDRKILRYLVSLDVEEDPKLGFSITFNFSPNPYFENKKLTKTFSFPNLPTAIVTGTTINWKEGLDKKLEVISLFKWLSRSEQIPISAATNDKVAYAIRECLWPNPLKYIIENSLEGEGGAQNVHKGC